jgi:hypothetical protein
MRDLGESRGESGREGNNRDDEDEGAEIGESTTECAQTQRGEERRVRSEAVVMPASEPTVRSILTHSHIQGWMSLSMNGYGSSRVSLKCQC